MRTRATLLSLVALVCHASCAARMAPYSESAFRDATSLKVEALALMDKATEPYADHAGDADALRLKLAKSYEYAHGRPKNEISAQQWAILKDPAKHLLGGFLDRWKAESRLPRAFVEDMEDIVGKAFDTIIGLESGKVKASDVALRE